MAAPGAPVISAALYDRVLAGAERRVLGRWRAELITAAATGDVLEIGAGTGANLPHYGPAVRRLLLLEPDPAMRGRLAHPGRPRPARARRYGRAGCRCRTPRSTRS